MTDRPQFSSRKCPRSAEFVLAMREAFGPDVEVAHINESGFVYGHDERERACREEKEQPTPLGNTEKNRGIEA